MRISKNIILENVLSINECNFLESCYFDLIKRGWNGYDHDIRTNSISISDPYKVFSLNQDETISKISAIIENVFDDKITYSHSYMRMYRNQSKLAMHTDRKGLDITLSVNVGGLENWPIYISNICTESDIDTYCSKNQNDEFKEDCSTFLTPRGSGVACYGNNFPHWRNELKCENDEYVLQIFYHWTIIN